MSLSKYVLKRAIQYKDDPKKWAEFFDDDNFDYVLELCLDDIRREERARAWREFREKAMVEINHMEVGV